MQHYLEVNLFGEFSVRWGDVVLVDSSMRVNKNMELFALLLISSQQPLSNEELMEALWEGEAVNPAGALKNAIYSLRRTLQELVPDVSFILTTGQQYQLNPDIPLQADFLRFSQLNQQMQQSGVSVSSQLELGRQALRICKGELLPCLSSRPWLLSHNARLTSDYIAIVCRTAKILLDEHRTESAREAFSLCSQTAMLAPHRDEIYPYLFAAMQQLEMKTAVINYYPVVLELCYNHNSKPVPRSVRQVYQWASNSNLGQQEDLMKIRMDLAETAQQELPLQGAYFCNYDSLRHIHHILARNGTRNGTMLVILLVSLTPKKNLTPSRQETLSAMATLRNILRATLRKDDIFCQFSRSQYVALLSMTNYDDRHILQKRLTERLHQEQDLLDYEVEIAFTRPDPVF